MHEGLRTVNTRILVADDSAEARQALCRLFASEQGLDVCAQAENGQAAIDQAQQHRPDLIILDLAMPVMNGLDAARVLKQMMPGTPIILATLHAETALEQRLRRPRRHSSSQRRRSPPHRANQDPAARSVGPHRGNSATSKKETGHA